jgi:4-hydroxybenzoate polyprenyltransferase
VLTRRTAKETSGSTPVLSFFLGILDLFLFSSLYISVCAVLMLLQTFRLFHLETNTDLLLFVFFSTICSYNFHWYLTPYSGTEKIRGRWTSNHKNLTLILYYIGLMGSFWFALRLISHWFWLSGAVILTFLYSAPKLHYKPFIFLRRVAVGKTIFLAFVWMYVTTFLPIVISDQPLNILHLVFCLSRFLLIYAICIIFDYRDRENDKKEGIRSMITYFNEEGINRLFYFTLICFAVATSMLYLYGFSVKLIFLLLVPGIIVLALYNTARKNFSDYLYYFVLDGLMMLSALLTSFISI